MNDSVLLPSCEPVRPSGGSTGLGEGLTYGNKEYYYRVGCRISKDKVCHLTWEGNYCGRVQGEREYLVVAWDGKGFFVLDHGDYLTALMKPFRGLTNTEAIKLVKDKRAEFQKIISQRLKCTQCGESVLVFHDNQPEDTCSECYRKVSQ